LGAWLTPFPSKTISPWIPNLSKQPPFWYQYRNQSSPQQETVNPLTDFQKHGNQFPEDDSSNDDTSVSRKTEEEDKTEKQEKHDELEFRRNEDNDRFQRKFMKSIVLN
jgi:hypothetical protein